MYNSWLKNVYSLFIFNGLNCVVLYTNSLYKTVIVWFYVAKTLFIRPFTQLKSTILSTISLFDIHLLFVNFSHNPHSLLLLKLNYKKD